ncbi:hypothetical protein SAMD00023353_4700740 [Rosellinia necatrix]|uniref:Uncharacterized protein n=1 Tax=Rosellinia necatrix TaxID=77044 RepID=A0A1W2TQV7_ROSNE|nr:hypothetical protein SAMD00023353_4700740 [Rosellinia necatrix]
MSDPKPLPAVIAAITAAAKSDGRLYAIHKYEAGKLPLNYLNDDVYRQYSSALRPQRRFKYDWSVYDWSEYDWLFAYIPLMLAPMAPRLEAPTLNGFHYGEMGLSRYSGPYTWDIRRPIHIIRSATANNLSAWDRKTDAWWKAQFLLYGIPFKKGDDMRGVALWALEEGLFDRPSDDVKALEARLAARYETNKKRYIERFKRHCKRDIVFETLRQVRKQVKEARGTTEGLKVERSEKEEKEEARVIGYSLQTKVDRLVGSLVDRL